MDPEPSPGELIRSPDGRVWKVQRVRFGLGLTDPPSRPGVQSGPSSAPADDALDRYAGAVTNARFLIFAVAVSAVALLAGYLAGVTLFVVLALAVAAVILTSPWWLPAFGVLLGAVLGQLAFWFALGGIVTVIAWLARNASPIAWLGVAIGLTIVLSALAIVLFRRPWTVEAVSERPGWKALRWEVRGSRRSRRVYDDVCDALWRGDAETFQPSGASPPRTVGL